MLLIQLARWLTAESFQSRTAIGLSNVSVPVAEMSSHIEVEAGWLFTLFVYVRVCESARGHPGSTSGCDDVTPLLTLVFDAPCIFTS